MKKIVAITLALMLLLSLSACGGKPEEEAPAPSESVSEAQEPSQAEPEPAPEPKPIPEAVLDPEEIEWGYEAWGDPESDSSDTEHWYVDGNKNDTNFIFFEDGYLTTVQGESRNMYDTEIVNMHVVDYETKGAVFDFVFVDVLTCYDLVNNVWYMRSDYDSIVESLTGATYVCDVGSQWTYTFNADGTFVHDDDGTLKPGTWYVRDGLTIEKTFDESDVGGWFTIFYKDDSWDIEYIEDMDIYYPES